MSPFIYSALLTLCCIAGVFVDGRSPATCKTRQYQLAHQQVQLHQLKYQQNYHVKWLKQNCNLGLLPVQIIPPPNPPCGLLPPVGLRSTIMIKPAFPHLVSPCSRLQ